MPNDEGHMYFSVSDVIFNEAGLTYCMITPVVLSILIIYYPNINMATLRITSFVGFYFGVVNMITWFILNTDFWWMGVLHLPLFLISSFGLLLSMRVNTKLHLTKNKSH
jgi:hypothetical protein